MGKIVRDKRVGCLGPEGTFSEEAALFYLSRTSGKLVYRPTLESIFSGITSGILDEGVVPVENSTEGAVGVVMDLLARPFEGEIKAEILLSVEQCILVRPGVNLSSIEKILSHPHALAQCREFLCEKMPDVKIVECASTAEAAERVACSLLPWAVVGSERLAEKCGLEVLVRGVNGGCENITRFFVIGRNGMDAAVSPRLPCKTSIILSIKDRPGALYKILEKFAKREINLTRIESRPTKKRLGDYLFFIDLEGGPSLPEVREALEEVKQLCVSFRILGTYPTLGKI